MVTFVIARIFNKPKNCIAMCEFANGVKSFPIEEVEEGETIMDTIDKLLLTVPGDYKVKAVKTLMSCSLKSSHSGTTNVVAVDILYDGLVYANNIHIKSEDYSNSKWTFTEEVLNTNKNLMNVASEALRDVMIAIPETQQ